MTNYKEILRLGSLGISNSQIAAALSCSRTTVITVQKRSVGAGLTHQKASAMSNREISRVLFPDEGKPAYKMPDYDYILTFAPTKASKYQCYARNKKRKEPQERLKRL